MADKKKEKLPSLNEVTKQSHYPSFLNLDENDYADIKDWKVGEKYKVELVVEQVSASKDELIPPGDTDADKVHSKFKVLEVLEGEPYSGKKESKKEEDSEDDEPKASVEKAKPADVAMAVKRKLGVK